MTTCLRKSGSFCLPCLSFVNGYQFLCVFSFPIGFDGGMWDFIALNPDHCLSIYFPNCVDGGCFVFYIF